MSASALCGEIIKLTQSLSPSSTGIGELAYQSLNAMNNLGLLINDGPDVNENAPKAYLDYILFDKNFVPYDFGFDQVSTAAWETFTCGNPDDGFRPALRALTK